MKDRTEKERRAGYERFLRDYGEKVRDDDAPPDFYDASLTCCAHGRPTRQTHCLNPNYPGCPFRDRENDYGYGRGGRERTYDR